jgi:ABC-2 type transport system ATP-binding protein
MAVLTIEGLSKSYGAIKALQDVSFEVPAGSVFGVLGPNGSGKTTLLGLVLEILYPLAGRFVWFESPEAKTPALRRRIGTLLETPNFYPYLTGSDNLAITASIRGYGKDKISAVLSQVGLADYSKLPFSAYSLGMKQRLALGASLLGEPEVLVLDEPTNGLDPSGIAEVRTLIKELSESGKTVILASHLLDEVEKVCTHVAILKKGVLLDVGSMEHVLKQEVVIDLEASDSKALKKALESYSPELHINPRDAGFRVTGQTTAQELNRYCFESGVTLSMLRTSKRDLESRFLELTDE